MSDSPTSQQFSPEALVRALVLVILRAGFEGHMRSIENPPGRRPPAWLTELSSWFSGLGEDDQRHAEALAWRSAAYSLQRVLGVLDGVIAVEGPGQKGTLRLTYERDGTSIRLNDPELASLEEILREELDAGGAR